MQLEEVCGRFESAWQAAAGGTGPRIEDYLASVPDPARPALTRELVRIDMDYRKSAGPAPRAEEYRTRFPDLDGAWLESALARTLVASPSSEVATGTSTPYGDRLSTMPGALALPARFDDYELLNEVARGGMGVVYKARQLSLNRVVALKMILEPGPLTAVAVQRFHREAQAAAALDHPNIVAVHASGQHDGRPYFTMAYVEGDNLREVVRRDGLPTPERAAALLTAVAEAVSYAHGHGIIHRDLKPENVLIDRHGRPRVTDFGLAYRPETPTMPDRLTHSGQVLGTPAYMSPEQAMSQPEAVGPATDVYSLGAILYFLLTGQPPFQGRTATEVLCRVLTTPPVPPRQVNPMASAALEAVCLRCLNKDPAQRYPSAEALAAALRTALEDDRTTGATGAAPPAARPGQSRWAWAGLAAAGLVGTAVVAWLVVSSWGSRPAATTSSPGSTAQATPAQLPPPESTRTDFALDVVMVDTQEGTGDPIVLRPDEGVIRVRTGQSLKFRVKVGKPAYVGVWSVNADGPAEQLFPNEDEKNHHFAQGEQRLVPGKCNIQLSPTAAGGTDWVWVQAATRPWDPDEGERDGPLLLFKSERQREKWEEQRRGMRLRPKGEFAEAVLRYRVEP
jgi:hypothetical protein